jgi:hypothetical protein
VNNLPALKEITVRQVEILADLLHELRPRWSVTSLRSMIWAERATADFPELVRAACAIAIDRPEVETPGIIFMTGKHWLPPAKAASPAHTAALGNDNSPECPNHPGVKDWECRPCRRADPPPPDLKDRIAAAAEAARKEREAIRVT